MYIRISCWKQTTDFYSWPAKWDPRGKNLHFYQTFLIPTKSDNMTLLQWVKLLRRGERHYLKWTWVHSLTPTDHYIQDDPRTVQDPVSTLGACVNCINLHMKFTSYTTPNYVNLILLQPSYVFTECSRVFLGKRKVEVAWRCWDIAHKQSYLFSPSYYSG